MTDTRSPPLLDSRDFDAIEAAVMETERGRWFLAEFARRNRLGETRLLLDAITRLEQNVGGARSPEQPDPARIALNAVRDRLAHAATELDGACDWSEAFGAVAQAASTLDAASADIHEAAERIGEIAWQLREAGGSPLLCGDLERAAADISTACAFGSSMARRAEIVGTVARDLTQILDGRPPRHRPAAPPPPTPAVTPPSSARPEGVRAPPSTAPRATTPQGRSAGAGTQAAAPRARPQASAGEVAPAEAPPKPARSRIEMPVPDLAAIEKLDFRERLKLFT